MPDDFLLSRANVAICGLGLMGGSLALALRGKCASLLGVDPLPATVELALSLSIVDRAQTDPAQLLPQADLVILAAPILQIVALIERLPALTSRPCVVLDVGSTKRIVLEAMSRLPENFDPIGGHPICGKENLSLANAEATLYHGAPFLLTPLARTSPRAMRAADQAIEAIGAHSVIVDAAEHDRMLAATSHLPFLISSALALSAPGGAAGFVGSGFKSASRLAGTPASMMTGVLRSNRENVLAALARFQESLREVEAALRSEEEAVLPSVLDRSRAAYRSLAAKESPTENVTRDKISKFSI
ncbi:MAG: prephenate dehydrogenase [Chloroflexota bacterium]